MKDKKGWVHTGSILDMLEQEGVCELSVKNNHVEVKNTSDKALHLTLDMIYHLAWELNEMADELEGK